MELYKKKARRKNSSRNFQYSPPFKFIDAADYLAMQTRLEYIFDSERSNPKANSLYSSLKNNAGKKDEDMNTVSGLGKKQLDNTRKKRPLGVK